jgi:hypothetical protein
VFCLLGYNALHSTESQLTFQRNMLPPSSGSKNKLSKKPPCHLLSRWYLAQLILFFLNPHALLMILTSLFHIQKLTIFKTV